MEHLLPAEALRDLPNAKMRHCCSPLEGGGTAVGILDQDSLDRGASCMVRGYGPSPGHDTWCGPGTTPMIAQSPADSPGMPGNGSSPAPAVVPGPTLAPIVGQARGSRRLPRPPHARAARRRGPARATRLPPRGASRSRPPRPRRSPRGTLPSGLRPCRRPQIRFTPSVRVISSRAPTTTSTRPISRATSPPGTTSPASW